MFFALMMLFLVGKQDYVDATGRRVTFEWALIAGENDTPEVHSSCTPTSNGVNRGKLR